MTTIVTRAGKGSPLTHTEVDTNFTNLNTAKLETAAIPLGTAAAPSISFLSDANTGIYSPEADTLAFVTAGSNRVHITSGGRVGMGSSSPQAKLHIALTSSATTPIVNVGSFGTAGSVTLGSITNNSEHVYLGTGDSNGGGIAAGIGFMREASGWNSALSFYTNNVTSGPNGVSAIQEKARIDSSGRLLVGTTSADGLISNISPVIAGAFKSHSGSVSIAPSTTVTIFTIPASNGEGAYTVTAIYVNSNNVASFSAYAVILYDGSATNAYRALGFDGGLLSITVSGRDVQLTTGATYTQGIKWSFVKQAVA